MRKKILIMGLPGAGKTTLANALAPLLNAVVFNADAVRSNLSRDLGFSHEDEMFVNCAASFSSSPSVALLDFSLVS